MGESLDLFCETIKTNEVDEGKEGEVLGFFVCLFWSTMAKDFLPRELFKNGMGCFMRVPHFHYYVKVSILNSLWAMPHYFYF